MKRFVCKTKKKKKIKRGYKKSTQNEHLLKCRFAGSQIINNKMA